MAQQFTVQARLTPDLHQLLQEECEQKGLSNSDVVRAALELYFYGNVSMQGPDAGFLAAKRQAHQLARAALAVAFDAVPDSYEDAVAWFETELARRQEEARFRRGQ